MYNDEDQSPDGDNSDDISDDSDSDLETFEDSKSENLLEKLKQKLDDSIAGNLNDLDKDDSAVIVDEKIIDVKKSDGESEKGKDKLCTEKKDKLCEDSDNDLKIKDTHEQKTNNDKHVKSMFKNISISLVGTNSKTLT